MIDEDADSTDQRRQALDDLCGSSCIEIARAIGVEVQANGVGAKQYSVASVFDSGNAADLDASNSRPRIAAAGSDEASRCAPMRKASAPQSRRSSMSALL